MYNEGYEGESGISNSKLLLDEVQHNWSQPQGASNNTSGFQSGIGHLLLQLLLLFWDFSTWTSVHFFLLCFSGVGLEKKSFYSFCFSPL